MTPSISAYAAEQKHATFLTGFHGVLHHPQCSCKSRRLLPVPNRFRVGVASTRTSIVGCGAGPWDVAPYLHCLHPTVICSSHECVFFFRAKIILGQPILLSSAPLLTLASDAHILSPKTGDHLEAFDNWEPSPITPE